MAEYRRLSDVCRELLQHDIPDQAEPREQAARLAIETYGVDLVADLPSLINCAALAIQMQQTRLTVHELSPGVVTQVAATDLHTLPSEPPMLLRGPWLLEVRRPDRECLTPSAVCLAGYPLDGVIYLIGFGHPDGIYVARWIPRWGEEELAAGVEMEDHPLITDVDAHHEAARDAARFAVILALLLEAEQTPLQARDRGERKKRKRKRRPGVPTEEEWITRRVSLHPQRGALQEASAGGGSGTTGRVPLPVQVRGHLKRQPYGPGRTQRRWVYIERYEARRWIAPKPLKLRVGI